MNDIHMTPDPALWLIPLPKAGETCPVSGFSKSTMYALTKGPKPLVATLRVKTPGGSRGLRRVVVASLLKYLYSRGAVSGELPECTKQALATLGLGQTEGPSPAVVPAQSGPASLAVPEEGNSKANSAAVFYGTRGSKPSYADVVAELVADGYPDFVARSMAYVSFPEMLETDETGLPA